jgi:5-formyltetrahydrofolate cyclo-ligase
MTAGIVHNRAMDKRRLRTQYLGLRRAMPEREFLSRSGLIHERLCLMPQVAQARTLLCYVSSKDHEVDTQRLIERFLREGKTVLVPIAQADRSMLWSRIESLADLSPARFGILEPREETRRITAPPDDAVVLVPGIAFSAEGYRIGYGGGYYDRFLAEFQGCSIGLAFDAQILGDFSPDEHDVPVRYVVTESRVYPHTTG